MSNFKEISNSLTEVLRRLVLPLKSRLLGTNVSGISLISGWSCLGGELQVEFSDENGVVLDHLTQTVLQGSERT